MEQLSPKDKVIEQLRENFGRVIYSQTTQVKSAILWDMADRSIRWLTFIFTAVTTGGLLGYFIADSSDCLAVSVVFSVVSVVLSTVLNSSDYRKRYAEHKKASDRLWIIREEYRSILADTEHYSVDELRTKRDNLTARVGKIYEESPPTGKHAYRLAQKALKNEEEQFFSEKELQDLINDN